MNDKHEVLEDIVKQCDALPFCEWLIEYSSIPKREIIQSYMVWKFKWNWGIKDSEDAWMRWAECGMAKKYAELYDGRCTPQTMYAKMVMAENELTKGY